MLEYVEDAFINSGSHSCTDNDGICVFEKVNNVLNSTSRQNGYCKKQQHHCLFVSGEYNVLQYNTPFHWRSMLRARVQVTNRVYKRVLEYGVHCSTIRVSPITLSGHIC